MHSLVYYVIRWNGSEPVTLFELDESMPNPDTTIGILVPHLHFFLIPCSSVHSIRVLVSSAPHV